jgi:transposase
MSRYKSYSPEQAYLLPPSVEDELSSGHLCFFLRRVVERLDLSGFDQAYAAEGGLLYAPDLMLSVWLYAYATGITSARQLERRLVEDLPLRYLAAGARVDNWALSAFRRRHQGALNDCFTQVLEMARTLGMGKLGRVAIDSTRIKASACRDKLDTEQQLRDLRAGLRRQVRRWQQMVDRDDADSGGLDVAIEQLESKLAELPQRLERLHKSGLKKLSRTDPDARFLRTRGGFDLGYTGEIARPPDRGPASDAERRRQRFAAADGGADRRALRLAAGPGAGRQRVLLHPEPGTDGSAKPGRVCAGLEPCA